MPNNKLPMFDQLFYQPRTHLHATLEQAKPRLRRKWLISPTDVRTKSDKQQCIVLHLVVGVRAYIEYLQRYNLPARPSYSLDLHARPFPPPQRRHKWRVFSWAFNARGAATLLTQPNRMHSTFTKVASLGLITQSKISTYIMCRGVRSNDSAPSPKPTNVVDDIIPVFIPHIKCRAVDLDKSHTYIAGTPLPLPCGVMTLESSAHPSHRLLTVRSMHDLINGIALVVQAASNPHAPFCPSPILPYIFPTLLCLGQVQRRANVQGYEQRLIQHGARVSVHAQRRSVTANAGTKQLFPLGRRRRRAMITSTNVPRYGASLHQNLSYLV